MKKYERLVSSIMYLNPEFQEKSGENQSFWLKTSILKKWTCLQIWNHSDSENFHQDISYETFRLWKYLEIFKAYV